MYTEYSNNRRKNIRLKIQLYVPIYVIIVENKIKKI